EESRHAAMRRPQVASVAETAWISQIPGQMWLCRVGKLELQVTIHEVVLLQPAKALADLTGTHRPDSLDGLELSLRGTHDRVEAPEVGHDPPDERLGHAWKMRQDPVPPRHDGLVERIDAALVAEHLREPAELEQLLVVELGQIRE